ncbi:hypothetical protein V8F20_012434 [Naviculisporaceae sp. PSN 640]
MASPLDPSGESRTESKARVSFTPVDELFDIHIDTQFANAKCQPIEYAREPWKHCRDALNTYLSIRYSKREEFLRKAPEGKRQRVQHEIERIERTRKNFSSYPNKKTLMKELADSRKAWEDSVMENLNHFREASERKYREDPENANHRRERELLRRLESWRPRQSQQLPHPRRAESIVNKVLNRSVTLVRRGSHLPPQLLEVARPDEGHESTTSTIKDDQIIQEPLYGFRASAIYFKRQGNQWTQDTHQHPRFIGKDQFPNQKISVHDLLEGADSPLSQECGRDTIRYFHFPTNNMSWIEKAIARYYREDLDVIDERTTFNGTTRKAEKLLAREYWRGQMHGSGDMDRATLVHQDQEYGRSGSTAKPKPPSRGMPYLHWETSSRRKKMVDVVNEAIASLDVNKRQHRKPTLSTAAEVAAKLSDNSEYKPTYKNLLGRYLLKVARVADEIDFEADERLLRDNVNRNPPLHIRRTIDQYYFPTLEDTSLRDKDQVVYRGTRAGRSFHAKNTRVVMVDQLWLWILDDHTIITSFPRRWGRNKPDPSGVHKSLRERLEAMSGNIKSIHHLGSSPDFPRIGARMFFFDRTKPLDQRPEVMDLFSSAIGHVTELTAVAYEGFWRNTALQSLQTRNLQREVTDTARHRYLEINPEGKLLQEAQDIAEELQIMKRIFNEQLQVVKDFRRHLDHLAEVHRRKDDSKDMANLLSRVLHALQEKQHTHTEDDGNQGAAFLGRAESAVASAAYQDVHEADVLLELIEGRKAEIQDKEDLALYACQHIEGLLSLKQQQASIVQAKAALRRADESVKQGRSIMAFTVVTIFFLPLGFFATFFGMNNVEINASPWMTLGEQIKYMFGFSAIIIALSVSMAFSAWSRAVLNFLFWVPLAVLAESTGLREWWKQSPANHGNLERRAFKIIENASKRRQKREMVRRAGAGEDVNLTTGAGTTSSSIGHLNSKRRMGTGSSLV